MYEAYIDGACRPVNPGGTASWGMVVFKIIDRAAHFVTDRILEDCGIVGSGPEMSNNVGEYAALIALLTWVSGHIGTHFSVLGGIPPRLEVRSDSNLLILQMTGKFKVRRGLYVPYYKEARSKLDALPAGVRRGVEFKWIPREENFADELAVRALGRKDLG